MKTMKTKEIEVLGQSMSSKDIALITGKEHKNVMQDIRILVDQLGSDKAGLTFQLGYYSDVNNQLRPMYELTKKEAMLLASGYNAVLRLKILNRLEDLESQNAFKLPTTFSEALMLASQQAEEIENKNLVIENQEKQLQISAPKTMYFDKVLNSTSTYTTTLIAKELGKSAVTLNRWLHDLKVQFKQNDTWVLYSKYQGLGYTKTTTSTYTNSKGETNTSMLTVWTESGRNLIHNLINQSI